MTVVRRSTLDGLRRLDQGTLRRQLGEFLSDREIGQVLERRDQIVTHFDDLIRSRGETNVVANVVDF